MQLRQLLETVAFNLNLSDVFSDEIGRQQFIQQNKTRLQDRLLVRVTQAEEEAVKLVAANRPKALRDFDQIPMLESDLLRQVKLMIHDLADKSVVFMGDHDSTSLLCGLLGTMGYPHPRQMILLDFDERLLVAAQNFAKQHGFDELLDVRLYNAFDELPADLVGQHDWFYTNPPYGCRNNGKSAHLFIARGCEAVRPVGGKGCIILPDDAVRPWTATAMLQTQTLLASGGWKINEKLDQVHRYYLDDDRELASSMMLVEHIAVDPDTVQQLSYTGRRVEFAELPHFYGLSVIPPYPRYVRYDGTYNYDWSTFQKTGS